jgi:hypothetical protein
MVSHFGGQIRVLFPTNSFDMVPASQTRSISAHNCPPSDPITAAIVVGLFRGKSFSCLTYRCSTTAGKLHALPELFSRKRSIPTTGQSQVGVEQIISKR